MGIVNQNASLHLPLLRRLHLCGATCSVLEVRSVPVPPCNTVAVCHVGGTISK
jgi:hypothetical protein